MWGRELPRFGARTLVSVALGALFACGPAQRPEATSSPGASTSIRSPSRRPVRPNESSAYRRTLQECYLRALEGADNAPTLRVAVHMKVDASGRASDVNAHFVHGRLDGLLPCITAAVRLWQPPPSSWGKEIRFPLIFTPPPRSP